MIIKRTKSAYWWCTSYWVREEGFSWHNLQRYDSFIYTLWTHINLHCIVWNYFWWVCEVKCPQSSTFAVWIKLQKLHYFRTNEGSKTTHFRVKLHLVFYLTPCMFTLQRQSKSVCKVQIFTKAQAKRERDVDIPGETHTHTHTYMHNTYIHTSTYGYQFSKWTSNKLHAIWATAAGILFWRYNMTSKNVLGWFSVLSDIYASEYILQVEFHISTLKYVAVSFYFRPSKPYQTNWIEFHSSLQLNRGLTKYIQLTSRRSWGSLTWKQYYSTINLFLIQQNLILDQIWLTLIS